MKRIMIEVCSAVVREDSVGNPRAISSVGQSGTRVFKVIILFLRVLGWRVKGAGSIPALPTAGFFRFGFISVSLSLLINKAAAKGQRGENAPCF